MAPSNLSELKARAEALRREGASMAEVARAVGRSPSTVYGWAAQGGWRLEEIEGEVFSDAPAPPGRRSSLIPGEPETLRTRTCALPFPEREGDGPEHQQEHFAPLAATRHSPRERGEKDFISPGLTPLEAAKALHQRSAELGAAGQIRAAEAAARLAERILRTEVQLLRAGLSDPGPDPDPEGFNEYEGGYRAELERRLNKLRAVKEGRSLEGL
ncbi:hypothetical protein V0U79_08550 [Hyphobacterium sp. HN65]|uniref:Helix-turn-helix domain-containing protein n=1 Tax=Hyphobacterium lacteum TaxID=3116575 RepID=A0ABU7LR71_9PROT|nr:hypothetical protein [Hyphobacterium sp. HN65]MEE2526414.1 hypothetical protein [Hyphobacterium sp. HN65]